MTDYRRDFKRVAEVARSFDVTTRTINRWIDDGLFPGTIRLNPTKPNSPRLIPVKAIEQLQNQQVIQS